MADSQPPHSSKRSPNQPDQTPCPSSARAGGHDSKPAECPVGNHGSGCPVDEKTRAQYRHPHVYNVYGERIDPANQMAANPNQDPAPGQKDPLSTDRVQSSIPKGGTHGTWLYPSPQMFFNALTRKGKGDDVSEKEIDTVVAIHNNMNERTWRQLLQWEKCKSCPNPTLLRFLGRPDQLTPKAWIKSKIGYGVPFDRHDWIVDRCGQEVRYVIDYYHDEAGVHQDKVPGLHDTVSVQSIKVDVRPAIDSFESFMDRLKNMFSNTGETLDPVEDQSNTPREPSNEDVAKLVKSRCGSALLQFMNSSDNPEKYAKAAIALNYCMGSIVCKADANALMQKLESGNEDDVEKVYDNLRDCLSKNEALKVLFQKADSSFRNTEK